MAQPGAADVARRARGVRRCRRRRGQAVVVAADADGRQEARVVCGLGRHRGRGRGAVLGDDLLERRGQDLPGEHLDVLLDVAGLGISEAHDHFEEILRVALGFADRQRLEALEVAPDAVLLLDREAVGCRHELLEEMYRVDRGDEALLPVVPPDAADADAVRRPLVHRHGPERRREPAARLCLLEDDDAPLVLILLGGPVGRHVLQVALDVQHGLVVRAERVVDAGAPEPHARVALREARRAHEGGWSAARHGQRRREARPGDGGVVRRRVATGAAAVQAAVRGPAAEAMVRRAQRGRAPLVLVAVVLVVSVVGSAVGVQHGVVTLAIRSEARRLRGSLWYLQLGRRGGVAVGICTGGICDIVLVLVLVLV